MTCERCLVASLINNFKEDCIEVVGRSVDNLNKSVYRVYRKVSADEVSDIKVLAIPYQLVVTIHSANHTLQDDCLIKDTELAANDPWLPGFPKRLQPPPLPPFADLPV